MTSTLRIAGRPVGVAEEGTGGVPLLIVHGYTGSKEDFDLVRRPLAADRRVVTVDLPGHGESFGSDDPDDYALDRLAAWVLAVADALGLGDDFHLMGHSMGGLVVQRVAAAASQRLHSLALLDTGLGALREEIAEVVAGTAVVARDHGVAVAHEHSIRALAAAGGVDPRVIADRCADLEAARARYLRMTPAAIVGGARALITAMPLGAFLRCIDVPVLVLYGEHDYAWRAGEQALLARSVAGARLVVVPDAFHSPHNDRPAAWLGAVRDFLDGTEREATRAGPTHYHAGSDAPTRGALP